MSSTTDTAVRTLAWWCPDWPLVAAGVGPDDRAVLVAANRVIATTPSARREGVAEGQRRREAQGRCPDLAVLAPDRSRDARRFEPVVAALEDLAPRIELTRPGAVAFPTRGPSRCHGGDAALARLVLDRAGEILQGLGWEGHDRVGVADGSFAAHLAARTTAWDPPGATMRVVPPGESRAFLASRPVGVLGRPELTEVLRRLGLPTLDAFAALDAAHVVARFGSDGLAAHRLAQGLEEHPPATTEPPPDMSVAGEVDPPSDRVDVVAFVARALASELEERLAAAGLSCRCVSVRLETDHGEGHERSWRHQDALSPAAVVDRVRWQVQGWIEGPPRSRPTSGIGRVVLLPVEVVPARGRQLGLWGGAAAAAERVARAVARIDGLLGPGSATVPERRGGRDPGEQVRSVPASAVEVAAPRNIELGTPGPSRPWPGRIPSPSPTLVHLEPVPSELVDAEGSAISVNSRRATSNVPARLSIGGQRWEAVEAWSLPWLAEQRWWDAGEARRRVRMQVVAGGRAHLLALESGRWWTEATYS